MSGELLTFSRLDAKRREQTPQALARLVVVGLFIGLWFLLWLGRIPMPVPFLLTLMAETVFFLVYWRTVSLLPSVRAVELAQYGMLAAEIVFHTTMVYFLGGISWMGSFAYVFGLIFANTFLDLRRGLVYTAGANLAFTALILLEATGTIPHYVYLEQGSLRYGDVRFVATTIIAGFGVFYSIYLWVNWVGHQLRQERDAAIRAQDGLLQARAQLQRANEELEERVKARTVELEFTNAALRESEEHLRTVVTNAPVVLFAVNRDGMFTLSEGKGLEVLGVRPGQVVGLSIFDVYRDVPEILQNIRRALAGEAFSDTVDVAGLAFETHYAPIHEAHGQIAGVIGIATNVTERKRAEEALRESEERLRTVVTNAEVILFALDRDGVFTLSEGKGLAALGLQPGEIVGQSVFDLFGDVPEIHTYLGRALAGEAFTTTVQLDAQAFEAHCTPVRDHSGEITGVIGVASDITERKRAEDALRESESKFRTMAETVAAAAFIFQGTRIRYVNSAAEAMTGYTRDELLAMDFWDVVHPDFRDLVKERGAARQQGEDIPPRYEVKLMTKSGEERWVDFTGGTIEFEGKPAVLGTAFDVTERKWAEAALQEAANHDPLTGLLNRRAGLAAIEARLEHAQQTSGLFATFILDLDRFKSINDNFSHETGDAALLQFAQVLVELVGDSGVICRLGGDEFEIGMDGTTLEQATLFAERLQASLRLAQISGDDGQCPQFTVSIGIACYPADAESITDLGRHADHAMYAAKAAGGDRVQAWRRLRPRRVA
ncbi:MAG: hypothetical protein A2148_02015 [Chloroflexi bacterium RBG_16_68_14]|nr:MAG: hypothetical protein A2148_02015 [Chloroflexi bacterium RBG_16_68_14]